MASDPVEGEQSSPTTAGKEVKDQNESSIRACSGAPADLERGSRPD